MPSAADVWAARTALLEIVAAVDQKARLVDERLKAAAEESAKLAVKLRHDFDLIGNSVILSVNSRMDARIRETKATLEVQEKIITDKLAETDAQRTAVIAETRFEYRLYFGALCTILVLLSIIMAWRTSQAYILDVLHGEYDQQASSLQQKE